jgi:hypothetical protein
MRGRQRCSRHKTAPTTPYFRNAGFATLEDGWPATPASLQGMVDLFACPGRADGRPRASHDALTGAPQRGRNC